MFEMIAVFSALTAPVTVPVHPPVALVEPPALVAVVEKQRSAQAVSAPVNSAATIASHSASSAPVAAARLARAYQ